MTRLLIHVEGETEEGFVNEILRGHLYNFGYTVVGASLLGTARQRARRGGIVSWEIARRRIVNHLKEDTGSVSSTMVDYYGMPNDWPGRANPFTAAMSVSDRAEEIEDALLQDVSNEMGTDFNPNRFIPYVMMHEFEAMLFSDCERFAYAVGRPDLGGRFQDIRDRFESPEEIDDSPFTAPAKRIESLIPGYERQKAVRGAAAALEIGIDAIRGECPHFREWLGRLERMPNQ